MDWWLKFCIDISKKVVKRVMKRVLDTHVHTISSGHAYSTLKEYVDQGKEIGLQLIGITDHGPKMPGGPHIFHLLNQRVIPSVIDGVRILKGAEVNIMDFNGNLDVETWALDRLEIIIASLHDVCLIPGNKEENTKALLGAMASGYVDVLGHTGNPAFPIDIPVMVGAAKKHDVLIEINNSSLKPGGRKGSDVNCKAIAIEARDQGAKIILGSDAHISYDLGVFTEAEAMLKEIGYPDEMIINNSVDNLLEFLEKKRERRV